MPQWARDETKGKDVATFRLEAELDRAEYAVLQAWRRDNADRETGHKPSMKQALAVALQIGLQEMGKQFALPI